MTVTGTLLVKVVPAAQVVPCPFINVQDRPDNGQDEMTRVTLNKYCPGATLAGMVQVADTDQPMPFPPR